MVGCRRVVLGCCVAAALLLLLLSCALFFLGVWFVNVEMSPTDAAVGRGRNSFLNFESKWVNERLKNASSFGGGSVGVGEVERAWCVRAAIAVRAKPEEGTGEEREVEGRSGQGGCDWEDGNPEVVDDDEARQETDNLLEETVERKRKDAPGRWHSAFGWLRGGRVCCGSYRKGKESGVAQCHGQQIRIEGVTHQRRPQATVPLFNPCSSKDGCSQRPMGSILLQPMGSFTSLSTTSPL